MPRFVILLILIIIVCLFTWICIQVSEIRNVQNGCKLQDVHKLQDVSHNSKNMFIKPHFDEKYNSIDVSVMEAIEQKDSLTFINSNDIVLELGARYGTVSTIVNNILSNKTNHVVVEPDLDVIDALKLNRNIHNCEFQIYIGTISNSTDTKLVRDGYASYTIHDDDESSTNKIESITYQQFKQRYPLNFNVLIMDCEGCAEEFMKTLGDEIQNYNKILLERDNHKICNYSLIENIFIQYGFTKIKDVATRFISHCIYINFNRI